MIFDMEKLAFSIEKEAIIRKKNGKYVLYSHKGKKLGEHSSKKGAEAQERAIQASKHSSMNKQKDKSKKDDKKKTDNKQNQEKTAAMGDGTGPMGKGPMTGRGMGYCAGMIPPPLRVKDKDDEKTKKKKKTKKDKTKSEKNEK